MHCTSLCKEGGRKRPGNAGTSTRAQRGAALSRVKTRIRRSRQPRARDSSAARSGACVRTLPTPERSRTARIRDQRHPPAPFIIIARDFWLRRWGWSVGLRLRGGQLRPHRRGRASGRWQLAPWACAPWRAAAATYGAHDLGAECLHPSAQLGVGGVDSDAAGPAVRVPFHDSVIRSIPGGDVQCGSR